MKHDTADYRELTLLSDTHLATLLTAYNLISPSATQPAVGAQLAALRIWAAFAFGLKRWQDALGERERAEREGGLEEGRKMVGEMVKGLEDEDVLLSRVLGECVRIGEGK